MSKFEVKVTNQYYSDIISNSRSTYWDYDIALTEYNLLIDLIKQNLSIYSSEFDYCMFTSDNNPDYICTFFQLNPNKLKNNNYIDIDIKVELYLI